MIRPGLVALAAVLTTASACASGASSGPVDEASPAAGDAASAAPAAAAEVAAPEPSADPAPASGAFYSDAQADQGRASFRAACAECHYSSEFRGSTFAYEWQRRTVWDLYREISRTMPESAPGSLEPETYADVIAYILRMNGFPAGDRPLPPDEAVLRTYSMASPGDAGRS